MRKKLRERGNALIMYTLLLPTLILPLIGLGIDLNILYIIQAKLSAAVDGAALGAGRLLGAGTDIEEIASEFVRANFPEGYWGAVDLVSDPEYSVSEYHVHTIKIKASVTAPLFFLRIFGKGSTTVSAYGMATRKETRVVLVLDRSSSLSPTVFAALKSAAIGFVHMFQPHVDQLALVVYSNSGIVLYPPLPRPWDPRPTGVGGTDGNFASNHPEKDPLGASQPAGDLLNHLQNLQVGGYTSMAEGLSLAWVELQKAFNRDGLGPADFRPNDILLFTDGVPTALAAYLNNPDSPVILKPQCPATYSASQCATLGMTPCTHRNPTADPNTQMIGRLHVSNPSLTPGQGFTGESLGLWKLASRDSQSAAYWAVNSQAEGDSMTSGPVAGCLAGENPQGLRYDPPGSDPPAGRLGDFSSLPGKDFYGNSTNPPGNPYMSSTVVYNAAKGPYVPTRTTGTNPSSAYQLGLAAWNATFDAAQRIRTDPDMKITIHVVAYTGTTGTDSVLLRRVANQKTSPWYIEGQPAGLYVEASNPSALQDAFDKIASEVLRLAQ